MKVLGIDPGLATIGFGIILRDSGEIRPGEYGKISTPSNHTMSQRLFQIGQDLHSIITTFKPDCVAIEKLFFSKNTKTAMSVAEARGALILTISNSNLPIFEYTPLQVKLAVCGYGNATKQQVQYMVKNILGLAAVPKPDDTADALAIAICHMHSMTMINSMKGYPV